MTRKRQATAKRDETSRNALDELRSLERVKAPWFFDAELQRRLRTTAGSTRQVDIRPRVAVIALVTLTVAALGWWWLGGGGPSLLEELFSPPGQGAQQPVSIPLTDTNVTVSGTPPLQSRNPEFSGMPGSVPRQGMGQTGEAMGSQSRPRLTGEPTTDTTAAIPQAVESAPGDTSTARPAAAPLQRSDSLAGGRSDSVVQPSDSLRRPLSRETSPRPDTVKTARDSLLSPP